MTHVDFRVRILPEDTEYLRKSPPEEFMYDAVDANLLMLVDGQSPFPSAGHRISPDGSLESVPILVFVWRLAQAVEQLQSRNVSDKQVSVTSTPFGIRFERRGENVTLRVEEISTRGGHELARTVLPLRELISQTTSTAQLVFLGVIGENPRLEANWALRGLRGTISALQAADRGVPPI